MKANQKDEADLHRKTRTATKMFNNQLKKIAGLAKIEKSITTHIARHSFGHTAAGSIPTKTLQHLYRHSSSTTTEGYQKNFIHKDVDEALEATLDF
jgi:site-specific recombinase XerD